MTTRQLYQYDVVIQANTDALRGIETALKSLEGTSRQSFSTVQTGMGQALGTLTGITGANLLGKIASGFTDTASAALGAAGNVEQMQKRYTSLLGGQQAANAELTKLRDLANNSAFTLPGLVQGETRLIGVGKSAQAARQELVDVGNEVAGMGGGKAEIDGVTVALSQMASKGHVMTQELNQISEHGIPALGILARYIGRTTEETQKLVETGGIAADVFERAFHADSVQRFGTAMADQAHTWNGLLSTASDLKDQVLATWGSGVIEAAEPILQTMLTDLQNPATIENIRAMGVEFGQFVTTIGHGSEELLHFLGLMQETSAGVTDPTKGAKAAYDAALAAAQQQAGVFTTQQTQQQATAAHLKDITRQAEDVRARYETLIAPLKAQEQSIDRAYQLQVKQRDLARAQNSLTADKRLAGDIFSSAGQAARDRLQSDQDRVTDLQSGMAHDAAKQAIQDQIQTREHQRDAALAALEREKRAVQDVGSAQGHTTILIGDAVKRVEELARAWVPVLAAAQAYEQVVHAAVVGTQPDSTDPMRHLPAPAPGLPGLSGALGPVQFGWNTGGGTGLLGNAVNQAMTQATLGTAGSPLANLMQRAQAVGAQQAGNVTVNVNVSGAMNETPAAFAARIAKATADSVRGAIGGGRR